ncbi:MAG: alkaline phosphatase family protein [Fimbriimonas sp.]
MRRAGIAIGLGVATIVGITTGCQGTERLGQQPNGSYLVSSDQRIELLGAVTRLEYARPKDAQTSPNGQYVAVLAHRKLVVFDADGKLVAETALNAGPLGLAWANDGRKVYATLSTGKIAHYDWDGQGLKKAGELAVEPAEIKNHPGTAGLAMGKDGTLYAALSIRNQVVGIGPEGDERWRCNVGVSPYHLEISPDGETFVAANRGGNRVEAAAEQGDPVSREPFQGTGVATANSAGTAVQIDPRTDAALKGSVTFFRTKGGEPLTVEVGRQPAGMAFSPDGKPLYVTESDSDSVSFVDVAARRVTGNLSVRPPEEPVFGQIPTDAATSADGKRLYVTLGGMNAVAVVETGAKPKVAGYVPTAWFPIAVARTGEGVTVACSKGIGSRPSNKSGGFGVHDSVGAVQAIRFDAMKDLRGLTRQVAQNNGWTKMGGPRSGRKPVPVPERMGEPSVFRHVVYIIKENLTYDAALGDMPEGNGDPTLCTFGEETSPNHHALAREFVLLDNFYISGTNSADGHQWVASSIANGYTEQNYGANARSYPYDGGDPLAFSPEGFLWTQAKKSGKSVRVFGEFVDRPSVVDPKTGKSPDWKRCWEDYKSGRNEIQIKAETSQAALRPHLNPSYIGFPSNVSDQWRADTFLKELDEWERARKMPELTVMLLPNDHTVGTRPGWPTPRAAVADNDLALGRIIERLSKSPFWKEMLIIVAQDDSQLGLDHVDGHRSVAFCVSPYTRRGAVVSEFYNHGSLSRTMGLVLGMPPLSRFDRVGRPMTACFTDKADLRPYIAKANRVPLDELAPMPSALKGEDRILAEACARMDWDEMDTQNRGIVNRAVWRSTRPGEPYPRQILEFVPEEDDDD